MPFSPDSTHESWFGLQRIGILCGESQFRRASTYALWLWIGSGCVPCVVVNQSLPGAL
jgi:hypothetical protein